MESKVMQVVPPFEPTLPGHQNDIVGFTYHIYIYPIVINGINSVQLIFTNVIFTNVILPCINILSYYILRNWSLSHEIFPYHETTKGKRTCAVGNSMAHLNVLVVRAHVSLVAKQNNIGNFY